MHGIKQLNVELKLSACLSEKTAMEKVHNYYDGFFHDAIEKALESFPDDIDMMVDSIEIDLGPIRPSDIPATLEKKLIDEISRRLHYSETSPQVLAKTMEKVLFKYLSSGYADMTILGKRYSSKELCALVVRDILESHDSSGQLVSVLSESLPAFFRFIDIVEEEDLKSLVAQMWPEGEFVPAFDGTPDLLRLISMALFYLEPELLSKMIDAGTSHDALAAVLRRERLMQAEDGTSSAAVLRRERLMQAEDGTSSAAVLRRERLMQAEDGTSSAAVLRRERLMQAEDGTSSAAILGRDRLMQAEDGTSSTASVLLERLRNDYNTYLSPSRTISLLRDSLSRDMAENPGIPSSVNPSYASSPLHSSSGEHSEDVSGIDVRRDYLIGKRMEKGMRVHLYDAGLVLLAPFFLQFFSRLQYLDERSEFLSPVLQARAVHILRYIATGTLKNQMEEYMVLEKALCGLPFDFPSGVDFKMTPKEYEEVENLYSTVLNYWNPFKEKTVNSLRQAFIMRYGTIERDDVGWIVRVEGQGLDILMDGIPWGYSMVSLPWADMFYIDWQ